MTTAANELTEAFINARNQSDFDQLQHDQTECLETFQATCRRLETFNEFSRARYQDIHKHFGSHTAVLKEMKRDLDSVFSKLRKIKAQLALKYPSQMEQVLQRYPPKSVPDDEE